LQYHKGPPEHDWIFTRLYIAKLYPGWTLVFIDSLSEDQVLQILAYEDGLVRWQKGKKGRK